MITRFSINGFNDSESRCPAGTVVAKVFYERLFEGRSPAEALRQAKIALLQREVSGRGAHPSRGPPIDRRTLRRCHPSFWAPFILWGG
jgi:CHAT domain-containing protein